MSITIAISDDTWRMLVDRKNPGESFDSVIRKALLEIKEKKRKV